MSGRFFPVGFLLDTNVLSEMLRRRPAAAVGEWFAGLQGDSLFVSVVTQAEMMLGARLLPAGRRRAALEAALEAMFAEEFSSRVLPFTPQAVPAYTDIVSRRRAAGRPIAQFDAQIAATARSAGMRLATRNTRDFELCGVEVVNPWDPA